MQGRGRDVGFAVVAVALIHLGLLQVLLRTTGVPGRAQADDEVLLQVVWVQRVVPAARMPRTAARDARRRMPPAHDDAPTRERSRPAPIAAANPIAAETTAEGRPLSAVYLSQVRDPATATAAPNDDLLRDRTVALPGAGSERFRMREPPSVARAVAGIGRLFGGEDPDAPCRDNRRSIRELSLHGDSAALQRHLDVERRLCRP